MKTIRYTGLFKSAEGHKYELEVSCSGYLQAFFLLTAEAIRMGRHYQLRRIEDEEGDYRMIGDILKVSELITE